MNEFDLTFASKYGYEMVKRDDDAGYDLHTPHDIYLPPGYEMCINTGLRASIHSPSGQKWFMFLVPRSSAGVKNDIFIKNTVGIIDPSYRGDGDEIKVWIGRRERAKGTIIGTLFGSTEVKLLSGDLIPLNAYEHCTFGDPAHVFTRERCRPDLLYRAGDRFAQAIFLRYGSPVPHKVAKLLDEDRGGFGSTGE